ncbi:unnamed protein product [Larinioides sclopetarius]|uniref:Uncharacterized protein n=1 Tax=Larinioides sclopetarius TaxID=280406 RepID=A0AAV1ZVF8_9ARAC
MARVSSVHNDNIVEIEKRNVIKKVPEVVVDYNNKMGGVDHQGGYRGWEHPEPATALDRLRSAVGTQPQSALYGNDGQKKNGTPWVGRHVPGGSKYGDKKQREDEELEVVAEDDKKKDKEKTQQQKAILLKHIEFFLRLMATMLYWKQNAGIGLGISNNGFGIEDKKNTSEDLEALHHEDLC